MPQFTRSCPFCKKRQLAVHQRKDINSGYESGIWSVHCMTANCQMIGPEATSLDEAREKYNNMGMEGSLFEFGE